MFYNFIFANQSSYFCMHVGKVNKYAADSAKVFDSVHTVFYSYRGRGIRINQPFLWPWVLEVNVVTRLLSWHCERHQDYVPVRLSCISLCARPAASPRLPSRPWRTYIGNNTLGTIAVLLLVRTFSVLMSSQDYVRSGEFLNGEKLKFTKYLYWNLNEFQLKIES